jgi:hypothetical protein
MPFVSRFSRFYWTQTREDGMLSYLGIMGVDFGPSRRSSEFTG